LTTRTPPSDSVSLAVTSALILPARAEDGPDGAERLAQHDAERHHEGERQPGSKG